MNGSAASWLLLIVSLPTRKSTARMRIWRALKSLGSAALRDGAYLLPLGAEQEAAFNDIAHQAAAAGGRAHLLRVTGASRRQSEEFERLFDRSADYAALLEQVADFRKSLTRIEEAARKRRLAALHRAHEAIARSDFFPGAAQRQARRALKQAEAAASPGEPRKTGRAIRRLDRREFRGKTWATRRGLWVDRMASAWLILRFIDTEARFLWLKHAKDCPRQAVGFDFDGARFTHVQDCVTFETLLVSFGLEDDPALAKLAAIVHFLDVGGVPVPDAAGVERVLSGARRRCRNDNELLAAARDIFDSLYAGYSEGDARG